MYKTLKNIYDSIVTTLLGIVILCILLQIFARYVLRVPIPWTEELARYILVVITVLGAGTVSRKGEHLGAFFLRDKAKGRYKGLLFACNSIIILFCLGFLFIGGIGMLEIAGDTIAVTMRFFKMSWLYYALIIGTVVMAIYTLRDLFQSVKAMMGKVEIRETGLSTPFIEED